MKLLKFSPTNTVFGYTTTKAQHNLSYTVGDDIEAVHENRKKLAQEINVDLKHWVFAKQCHSDKIAKVTQEDASKGAYAHETGISGVDGLYTFDSNLVLAFFHADCVPILIHDPVSGLIGAIHSGWQGTLMEITKKAIDQIVKTENINPSDLKAYIGPCLDFQSSRIEHDIQPYLAASTFNKSKFIIEMGNSYQIDMVGLTYQMLINSGVQSENILNIDEDTFSLDDKYFSYQRDKTTGRHLTFIYKT